MTGNLTAAMPASRAHNVRKTVSRAEHQKTLLTNLRASDSKMNLRSSIGKIMVAVAFLATATFVSCYQNTAFYRYFPVNIEGWEKADFLEYSVPSVSLGGYYVEEIGVSTSRDYPYRQLSLAIQQKVISTTGEQPMRVKKDTIVIDVYDEEGRVEGRGVNLKQHTIPFKSLRLHPGDSIMMRISHNMQRLSVKGVSDVGVKVTRQYAAEN